MKITLFLNFSLYNFFKNGLESLFMKKRMLVDKSFVLMEKIKFFKIMITYSFIHLFYSTYLS